MACEDKKNDIVEGMCGDSAVALLKVLFMYLRGRTEESRRKPRSRYSQLEPTSELGTSRVQD